METITTEVVESGRKYDVNGRRLIPAVEREAYLAAFERSGLTQAEFARRERLTYTTFCSWCQERRACAGGRKRQKGKMRFEEVRVGPSAPRELIEVRLPDGVVIRGASARDVAELWRAWKS